MENGFSLDRLGLDYYAKFFFRDCDRRSLFGIGDTLEIFCFD